MQQTLSAHRRSLRTAPLRLIHMHNEIECPSLALSCTKLAADTVDASKQKSKNFRRQIRFSFQNFFELLATLQASELHSKALAIWKIKTAVTGFVNSAILSLAEAIRNGKWKVSRVEFHWLRMRGKRRQFETRLGKFCVERRDDLLRGQEIMRFECMQAMMWCKMRLLTASLQGGMFWFYAV